MISRFYIHYIILDNKKVFCWFENKFVLGLDSFRQTHIPVSAIFDWAISSVISIVICNQQRPPKPQSRRELARIHFQIGSCCPCDVSGRMMGWRVRSSRLIYLIYTLIPIQHSRGSPYVIIISSSRFASHALTLLIWERRTKGVFFFLFGASRVGRRDHKNEVFDVSKTL